MNPEYDKLLFARLNLVGCCHPVELVGVAGLELTGHAARLGAIASAHRVAVFAVWLALREQARLNLHVATTDCHCCGILGSCVAAQDLVNASA